MSCDICERSNCCVSFHSLEEQDYYSEVIVAFDIAREIRERVRAEILAADDDSSND